MRPTKHQLITDLIAITDKHVKQGAQFKPEYLDILTNRVLHWFPHDGVPVAIALREKLIALYPHIFKDTKMKKTCTHCGRETHSQPQDYNHDTGYGHCYTCLDNTSFYEGQLIELTPIIQLYLWEELNHGELTSDDSHAKVIELKVADKLVHHFTTYDTKEKLINKLKAKYC